MKLLTGLFRKTYGHDIKLSVVIALLFIFSGTLLMAAPVNSNDDLNLTTEEKKYLADNPQLVVLHSPQLHPYTFTKDGVFHGYWIDLLEIMFNGLDIKLLHGTRKRSSGGSSGYAEYLIQDRAHILTSLLMTEDRRRKMLFSNPVVRVGYPAIIVRSGGQAIRNAGELSGMRVALPAKHPFELALKQQVLDIDLISVGSFPEALEAVSYGLADATLQDIAIAKFWSRKRQIPNLRPTGPAVLHGMENQVAAFAVAKDNILLQSILDKLLAQVEAAAIEKLRGKWFLSSTDLLIHQPEAVFLSKKEQEYLNQLNHIRICVDPDWMPFERIGKNNEYEGIVADLVDLMSERLEIVFTLYQTDTWHQSLEALQKGACDVLPAAAPTGPRREWMDFTQPHLVFPLVIAVNSKELFVEDLHVVKDKKLGVVKSYAHIDLIRRRFPKLELIEVGNVTDGLKKVQSGELFGFIDTVASIGYVIRKDDMFDLKIGGKLDINLKLSMAVKKGEDFRLLGVLDKAVASVKEQEKKALIDKWFQVKFEQGIDHSLVWKVVIASTTILLIFLLWNRKLAHLNKVIARAHAEVKRLSITDQLTGLVNRRQLDCVLNREVERVIRYDRSLSIVMIDVDHFKSVNDTYGHDVGDSVLVAVSLLLKDFIRMSDIVGRWGGEEFLLICPETDLSQCALLAENLRTHIATADFPPVGHQTASFGVATFTEGDTVQTLIKRSDRALYTAKEKGRNKVVTEDSHLTQMVAGD